MIDDTNEENGGEVTTEVEGAEFGDMDCYKIPEGMQIGKGETVTVPTETEFVERDGALYVKGINTIDGMEAELMEETEEPIESESEEDKLRKEGEGFKNKAIEADKKAQLGYGNM